MVRKVNIVKITRVICTYGLLTGLSTSIPSHAMNGKLLMWHQNM